MKEGQSERLEGQRGEKRKPTAAGSTTTHTHPLAAACRYECERAGGASASPGARGDKKTDRGSVEERK